MGYFTQIIGGDDGFSLYLFIMFSRDFVDKPMSSSEPIHMQSTKLDSLLQSFSVVLQQLTNTNQQISTNDQAILSLLANQSISSTTSSSSQFTSQDKKVCPKSLSGLQIEDILSWLDHFENVAGYHGWNELQKLNEVRTVLEGIAATWYVQQYDEVKQHWSSL